MPLLHNGELLERNPWVILSDDDALPDILAHSVVSLTRFLEMAAANADLPHGVVIEPADNIGDIEGYMDQLQIICITFPVFTEGRGFSHARLLRKRFGYSGEIRAVGDMREDQLAFMVRVGFDSFDMAYKPDTTLVDTLSKQFSKNYQPSYPIK